MAEGNVEPHTEVTEVAEVNVEPYINVGKLK